VGALTEKDFRFEVRVWYLEATDSICPGCSTGCNIQVHANTERKHHAEGRRVVRLKPRFNPEVNQWWMCDIGRYAFKGVDEPTRITAPMMKNGDEWIATTWEVALAAAADKIKKALPDRVGIIASPQMTNEDLFALKRFAENLHIQNLAGTVAPKDKPLQDNLLLKSDRNPNTRGTTLFGFGDDSVAAFKLLREARAGKLAALLIFHYDLTGGFDTEFIASVLQNVPTVIFVGTNHNPTSAMAHMVLPAAAWAEKDGTFTNFADRVQMVRKAVDPAGDALPEWMILKRLGRELGVSFPYFEAQDVFAALTRETPVFKSLSYELIGEQGFKLGNVPQAAVPARKLNKVPDQLRIIPIFE
jgi:NADH-quinone oxidoreductase subunit G